MLSPGTGTHLIDVRTPSEFSTGSLPGALNIDYQSISLLAEAPGVAKNDKITLYCRSGRRSGIALETLKSMGFQHVRNIGSLEEARATLRREARDKQNGGDRVVGHDKAGKERRDERFGRLLEGLKEAEERES
ncbi:hypothetical protein K432DRAFT_353688 [Lepidopterella palustris CBS 459.81]|uniref:Rhodanese domain-containing protein n=1 Tax=Lepidopterella palustris CBS 459.81 TaxID=1314670 RepID=A0A8E2JEZ8_9PEZI|nr:hypothetical protein K432DRAFT_353688 [Lepidopterella palustris CBS 459.81]